MKRFFTKLAVFLVLLALPFAAYFGYVQSLPNQFTGSLMGGLHMKITLLEETPSPRVILVGGSSSPYATVCADVEAATGLPCINIGVTAYFGADYYVSLLEKHMQEGDSVVFAPEASMLAGAVDYTTLWYGIETDWRAFAATPKSYLLPLAQSYRHYAAIKRSRAAQTPAPAAGAAFGPQGDITLFREPLLESGYNREDPIALSPSIANEDVLAAFNRFAKKAAKNGVAFYFAFAPVDALAVTSTAQEIAALETHLRTELTVPVLGHLEDAILPGQYFYDSNNHLTTAGAEIYTAHLIALLQEVL